MSKALAWIIVATFAAVVFVIFVTMSHWNAASVIVDGLAVAAYGGLVFVLFMSILMRQRTLSLQPTEWMKRGGLMAAPEADAQPDEIRIRLALRAMPDDIAQSVRAEVEDYLAMPDGDEKQLRRDRLIRTYYDKAASTHGDFAHRRAYNAIRLSLSPWADANTES